METETIFELILTIVATFIAIIEFWSSIRLRIQDKNKLKCIKKLKSISEITQDVINELNNYENQSSYLFMEEQIIKNKKYVDESYEKIRAIVWGSTYSRRSDGDNLCEGLIKHIEDMNGFVVKVNENICNIYQEILKNESEFSLSYGFGRYIDVMRPLVFGGEIENYKTSYEHIHSFMTNADSERIDYFAKLYLVNGDINKIKHIFNDDVFMLQAISKDYQEVYLNYYDSLQVVLEEYRKIVPYLKELAIRIA